MNKKKTKIGTTEKVIKVGLVREDGWLYFIDEDGDIARMWIEVNVGEKNDKQG